MPKLAITINTSWNIFNYRMGLLNALEKKGFEIFAVAPKDNYSSKIGYPFLEWNLEQRGQNIFAEYKSYKQLFSIYNKLKPDVVLHYTIKPNIYGTIAANRLKIPSINNVSGLGYLFEGNPSLPKKIKTKFYLNALSKSDKIFFQNNYDYELFLSLKPSLASISDKLPGSGVNIHNFRPFEKIEKKEITFLMASRLFKEKGVLEYIESAKLIKQKFPLSRFLLIGDIYQSKNNPITIELLKNATNDGFIEYLGMQDDVYSYIKQSDCMILPTYYREGCPRCLIEAASSGLPIITTNNVGCTDIVVDGYNGFLCEKQSVSDLVEKIEKFILLSWKEKITLGSNGRKKVVDEFDEQIIIKKYIESIQSLL
jgi:glycosyltransferase involved in cell wall biosynthesis